ncbi:helix-turn-helix transcriptional regulator [Nocardia yamanashiensis]|uniref:helix-turn-helix transcriptional regulator n=1 Tax=Nocardia yamanashiensis TaxID=209247 RepID=UPI0008337953|nr:AraC family transcriptional regulator [Nocardia yamanashiensis]
MTRTPDDFAVRPESGVDCDPVPDALSELLDTVRLRGDGVHRYALADGARLELPARRVLHIVESGTVRLRVPGENVTVTVDSGDMVVLARGDAHRLEAVGGPARWVTGSYAVDEMLAAPLLSVLAPAIVIGGSAPGREWLPLSMKLLLVEVTDPRPGAAVMISRILDLLFVHALRAWSADAAAPGWLTAALDPALAPVITAVHRDPARAWTIPELAALANMSRTSFAERFTRRLGSSPGAYLADRRLSRAAELLRSTDDPVAAIAHHVGYDSEAAFSRAFRRRYELPPLRFRNSTLTP